MVTCHKEGNCPNEKDCFNYCVGIGYKQYGGRCTSQDLNLCCCASNGRPPQF